MADPNGYRIQFAVTRRLCTFPERQLFRVGDRPITCRGTREYAVLGVSVAGWLKPPSTFSTPSSHGLHRGCTVVA